MYSVSLVIPTYNEAKNLPFLVEEIFHSLNKEKIDLEIIFVDDNSPDGTGIIAEALKHKYPVRIIHRSGKLGLGSAVIAGFNLSSRPYLGAMDADLSHDPAQLNNMILSMENNDIAIGSRFEQESEVENWVWWRKLISEAGVFLARLLIGVKDPLSGYFFVKRDTIDGVLLTTKGYKILLEILVKGKYQKVKEFSFNFRMRKFSTSKLNTKEYWMFLKQIVSYAWYKISRAIKK